MRVVINIFFFLVIVLLPLSAEVRSFNQIFPNLSPAIRTAAFSSNGFSRSYERAAPSALIGSGQSTLGSNIVIPDISRQPFLVETIMVIPGRQDQYTLLKVYNALGQVRGLQGRLYHSHTRNDEVPLFEEVTRIEGARNTPVADPPPAARIPSSETIHMRLKDVNFGNTFYRAEMEMIQENRGLRYTMTNNRVITYLLMPVIREGNFTAQLYFEPILEGMLIYGLAGADVSNFVSSRISMTSAIDKRLAVIIGWVSDGIRR